jgi:hypothetical protein
MGLGKTDNFNHSDGVGTAQVSSFLRLRSKFWLQMNDHPTIDIQDPPPEK